MELDTFEGNRNPLAFPLRVDSDDSRGATGRNRACLMSLELQCETQAPADLEVEVGQEVDAAGTDVAQHAFAVIEPDP